MKNTFFTNLFIWCIVLGFTFTTVAQESNSNIGKVPSSSEKRDVNYTITSDPLMSNTGYGHASISGEFVSMPIPAGTPFTNIAPMVAPGFLSSGTFGPTGILYFTDTVTGELYTVDTGTGALTLVGPTGVGLNGITYDWSTDTFWGVDATSLYTVDVATGATTLVGPFGLGGGELMIDVAVSCAGEMYAYDLISNVFYSINPATGAATLIGDIGFDANFGQGMSYDHAAGILYLSAFNLTTNTGQLRTVDVATGMTTLLFDWGFEQVAAFAIDNQCAAPPNTPTNLTTEVISATQINIYWQDNSSNEDGFRIERNSAGENWTEIATVGVNENSYGDIGLTPNKEYCYRVRAYNAAGNSEFSNAECATTTPTAVEDEFSGIPSEFGLFDNYPNPFNPSTSINYRTPVKSFVSLKVYDMLGKEVATLVNEEKGVGTYKIDFNATSLPSGIYFYRLQAGSFVETKKMVLMK